MTYLVPAVASVVAFAIALWSRRFHRRVRNTPTHTTYVGTKYGMLWVLLFPVSAVFAVWAIIAAISNAVGDRSGLGNERDDDACETLELALRWLASDEPTDRGLTIATSVWDRSLVDDAHSVQLRENCPTLVAALVDAEHRAAGGGSAYLVISSVDGTRLVAPARSA